MEHFEAEVAASGPIEKQTAAHQQLTPGSLEKVSPTNAAEQSHVSTDSGTSTSRGQAVRRDRSEPPRSSVRRWYPLVGH
jgi:hypothetical protein